MTTARTVVVPATVGWVEDQGTVYPATLPDGPPLVLVDVAALVWLALVEGGTVDDVVARVASRVGRPPEEVAAGVEEFVTGLRAAGVLELR